MTYGFLSTSRRDVKAFEAGVIRASEGMTQNTKQNIITGQAEAISVIKIRNSEKESNNES